MGEHNFWIEMRDGSPIMVWKNGGCRAATQPELELSDANRELTRQVEQLQARVDAAERLVVKWRASRSDPLVSREHADDLESALTAPPSSSDPGRADTGREEK